MRLPALTILRAMENGEAAFRSQALAAGSGRARAPLPPLEWDPLAAPLATRSTLMLNLSPEIQDRIRRNVDEKRRTPFVSRSIQFRQPQMTPAVRALLIAIVSLFLLQKILQQFAGIDMIGLFGFAPVSFVHGYLWQPLTYPFLHGGPMHLLLNGFLLYMLGSELEFRWGTKRFLYYYAVCGVGGALLQMVCWGVALLFFPTHASSMGDVPIIGASGALFGIMIAFARLYGDVEFLVFFVFPMKARYFVLFMIAFELYETVFESGSGVAHLVHLGGCLTGYLYLRWRGDNLDGRGGGGLLFGRKRAMDRDEVRRRLNLIVNKDPKEGSSKYPITWN